LTGVVPTILAASAGSSFGPDGEDSGPAGAGFWHGYTIVRLDASGDPAKTIVDQRPVFDWISLSARDHTMRPGQKMTLQGFGREPAGQSDQYEDFPAYQHLIARYDRIDSPAITHRYDLLEADPQKPWLPRVDPLLADDPGHPHGYVRLDPSVATVDQSGQVIAQRGARGRVHAIAVLSVGDKAATWPLVFEPSRLSVPVTPPPKVLGISAASVQPPAPPPPAAGTPPINATIELPAPPALPGFPAGSPLSLPPPVPPAPPAPPGSQHALPVNLTIQPIGVAVPPTTGVTAQPTPPVNPSPPSGARREAKQRQAATAKSEEGSSQAAETQGLGGDPANGRLGPEGAAMTRRDRVRAEAGSLTPLPRRPQASAWVTGLEWTGGTLLMALVLAFGWITARPTPRRRPGPDIRAAPAWAPSRHR
jgi:hypothetical protein